MPSIAERAQRVWQWASQAPTVVPSTIAILPGHTDQPTGGVLSGPVKADDAYFQVRINQMFLTNERKWLTQIAPVVLTLSEFTYGGQPLVVPFTVGPNLLAQSGAEPTSKGMLFSDTRVAGIHPYRGDRLILSVRLYQLATGNVGDRILRLVEGAASALDFSTSLSTYLRIADVVLDGMEDLLGLAGMQPVVGLRTEFDYQGGNGIVSPAYFALIDEPDVEPSALWVRDDKLYSGPTEDALAPFRSSDFVLYSIVGSSLRDDATSLPWFGPLWRRVVQDSSIAKDDAWQSAKANMSVLNAELMLSPDLVSGHALQIADEHVERMKALHQRAVALSNLSTEAPHPPEEARLVAQREVVERAARILSL